MHRSIFPSSFCALFLGSRSRARPVSISWPVMWRMFVLSATMWCENVSCVAHAERQTIGVLLILKTDKRRFCSETMSKSPTERRPGAERRNNNIIS